MQFAMGEAKNHQKPYWFNGNYPLIVVFHPLDRIPIEELQNAGRLIFVVIIEQQSFAPSFFGSEQDFHERLLFDCDFEICHIDKPTDEYFQYALVEAAKSRGYKISKKADVKELIERLKKYRKYLFAGNQDIETFITRTIKRKIDSKSQTLDAKDFDKVLVKPQVKKSIKRDSEKKGESLHQLIGLEDVKAQFDRVVKRMAFDRKRREQGLRTEHSHMSAVFMGNPGTAKTTVARLFGKMLCDQQVLNNQTFLEVSRKDLVGKFVGWTAPKVAEIFEQVKGGTIFIDEAYSLLDTGGSKDGFSDEAISEIIQQMENNPDTLVIFAGYTDEMRNFIKFANPGLRSRLTNVIEFPDYNSEEMCDIFNYLIAKEEYKLENAEEAKMIIQQFLARVQRLEAKSMGNGRLMRKLFKTAVNYMAERGNTDYKTIASIDLKKAIDEIEKTERITVSKSQQPIGFY